MSEESQRPNLSYINEAAPDPLQAFVDVRGKPAVFLFLEGSMDLRHVVALRACVIGQIFEDLDVVINSGGGDIHSAYQMVSILRLHTNKLNVCVPFYAKSAATLFCIGADEIVLDELAQLGPIDTQIPEDKGGGEKQYTSALNPFKALEQLQAFSLDNLDQAARMILSRTDMNVEESLRHAMDFVRATASPLFAQLEPEKFGTYSRALSVGEEYGKRLLRRFNNNGWNKEQQEAIIKHMVHEYPSHEYIIDYAELLELGFPVELFQPNEQEALNGLFTVLASQEEIVQCVTPTDPNTQIESQAYREEHKHEDDHKSPQG